MTCVTNSPPIADSLACLSQLLQESREGFEVQPIGLADMPSWHWHNGALSHVSGGFFSVVGVRFDLACGVPGRRDGVYLYQPQSAFNGLLVCEMDGEQHFLLQARAEPGNVGKAQFGPTVQSTPANYLRVHGGKTTPYFEWFSTFRADVRVSHDSVQLDLGGRYLFKSKRVVVAQCPANIAVQEGFAWVPARLLNAAVAQSTFLNTDLRALLGVCAWGKQPGGLVPVNALVQRSSSLPLRPDAVADVVQALQCQGAAAYAWHDIAQMPGWRVSGDGIHEVSGAQGFDVGYFAVEARRREVARWQQPLIRSRSQGCARLLCREVMGALEVLVQVGAEPGLQTGRALLPSYLRYPGAAGDDAGVSGNVLLRTLESDEGGGFFRMPVFTRWCWWGLTLLRRRAVGCGCPSSSGCWRVPISARFSCGCSRRCCWATWVSALNTICEFQWYGCDVSPNFSDLPRRGARGVSGGGAGVSAGAGFSGF